MSLGQTVFFLDTKYHAISVQRQTFDLLEGWLRHKSDMVNYEAARAICEMKNISGAQLTKSIAG